jgi:hypothetical protein
LAVASPITWLNRVSKVTGSRGSCFIKAQYPPKTGGGLVFGHGLVLGFLEQPRKYLKECLRWLPIVRSAARVQDSATTFHMPKTSLVVGLIQTFKRCVLRLAAAPLKLFTLALHVSRLAKPLLSKVLVTQTLLLY